MIGVLCASPSCRAVTQISPGELPRGLVAVLTPRGWSYERQGLDIVANWYCPRCRETTDDAA